MATKVITRTREHEALTDRHVSDMRSAFEADPAHRLMQNAVAQHDVNDVALDRTVVTGADHTFSHVLDDWSPTHQGKSGRCWLFAGLNLLRVDAMKAMNVKKFEFSQSYLMFWDKLERANFLLESIIDTADRPLSDRTVAWLLDDPLPDAGQWDMFVSLIRKHGVVPKATMPETESSMNTARMNSILYYHLRQAAARLRGPHSNGAGDEATSAVKHDALKVIYRILSIHLGTPPERFQWQWTDQDGQFHRDGETTPLEFAQRYVATPADDSVCLVHDPRETSPLGRTFTIGYLGNVVGGGPVKYLNVDIDLMKRVTLSLLLDGKPVWMGCDTGKQSHPRLGLWDAGLFDYPRVYGTDFSLTKAQRLDYHQTQMTHAMLFTGVDVADDVPRRWRVENSYGDEGGDKGFFLMNDSWFDEYMFEIAVPRSYVPAELHAALELEPIVLPPWDPMGALARMS